MRVTNIQEAGCSNILRFAIANGADLQGDVALQGLIGNEMFYLVTYADVTFFELMQLTLQYREKLRIINGSPISPVEEKELAEKFPGMADKETPMKEVANHVINRWLSLAMQMNGDQELISPAGARMFLPMLARKFSVQIPVAFADLINAVKPQECSAIFNSDYPDTLQTILDPETLHYGRVMLEMNFVKGTAVRIYGKQLEAYLKMMKYAPLRSVNSDRIYKFALSGFHKYDNLARSEVRFSMFQPNAAETARVLKRMNQLNTPLITDWVVQMPIQYMQELLNSYSEKDLPIMYPSSASGIIDAGFTFHDYLEPNGTSLSEENTAATEQFQNAVTAYQQRIEECNAESLAALKVIMANGADNGDLTNAFGLFPSIYNMRGILSIDMSQTDLFLNHYDSTLSTMFQEMFDMAQSVIKDLKDA